MPNTVKKQKSLAKNALLSALKTLTSIIFPLITYPYITRVLAQDDIGRINFSQSIIGYFNLIAVFGITTFAVRNGAQIRDNREEFSKFADSIFTINIITTTIACVSMILLTCLTPRLAEYKSIIFILGITVAMVPFALDWLYTIYEDFAYITLRSFFVYLLSLILMLLFVKKESDVYIYVSLTTASTSLGNVFNFVHSRKYTRLRITKQVPWKKYRSSILIFFVNSIASTIYLNSDTTILGLMQSNRAVALYGVATKIYYIVKQLFNTVIASTIPRLAYYKKNSEEEFNKLLKKILDTASFFIFPALMGVILLRKEIILCISNSQYMDAADTLAILSIALFFAVFSNIFANGLLICIGKEQYVLRGTVLSAAINVGLNFIFIPWLAQNGAAITTLIAEITMVSICAYAGKEYLDKIINVRELLRSLLISICMFAFGSYILSLLSAQHFIIRIIICVIVCSVFYAAIMAIIKDPIMKWLVTVVNGKLHKVKCKK